MDAGQVVSYKMNDDGTKVVTKIFIHKPYDKYVNVNTRFWQSGGVNLSLGADGLKVNTESIVSIMAGGVSFSTPAYLETGELAPKNHEFIIYQDKETAFEPLREKYPVLFYFNGSVRGLTVGAPVEFRGIKIGEVTRLHLQIDTSNFDIKIPVTAELEKGHFEILGERQTDDSNEVPAMTRLVENGLRAQLKTGSLLTGAIYIDFDIYEDSPPASLAVDNGVIVLPTIPTALDAITSGVTTILNKIAAMPLEQIGKDLGGAVKRSRELLESNQIENALRSLDETLKETHKLARGLNTVITPQLDAMLRELKNASRSIKSMADYLERHPEALIQGKQGGR
jgi:paraquat-inducible protein B